MQPNLVLVTTSSAATDDFWTAIKALGETPTIEPASTMVEVASVAEFSERYQAHKQKGVKKGESAVVYMYGKWYLFQPDQASYKVYSSIERLLYSLL
jgi:hypothetical protein